MRVNEVIKILFFLLVLLLISIGCSSTPPSKFYTLNFTNQLQGKDSSPHEFLLAVGPVRIPDYLDRPQIVIRTGANNLTLSEYDRWAGSLNEDIARVLSEGLSKHMGEQVSVVEWDWGVEYDWRVALNIARFDIMPDNTVVLHAEWSIFEKTEATLLAMEATYVEPVHERTYQGRISSMNLALQNLSRDIAGEMKSVIQKKSASAEEKK